MQAVDESRPNDGGSGSFLSPGKAFALLAGVIVVIGAVLFVTRPDAAPAPPNTPANNNPAAPPTFELTDAEALTRLSELLALRDDAYETRDLSLLSSIYVPGTEVRRIASTELEQLRASGVIDQSSYRTKSATTILNTPTEVRIREEVVVHPRFVTESGENVTKQRRPVRQLVLWTLRLQQDGEWLIYDALITKSEIVRA